MGNTFEDQRRRLLANLELAHEAYYEAETFGGPSLHFHKASLDAARVGARERFAEMVYATLASWGMHRMGKGGSKMCNFSSVAGSLDSAWPLIAQLQQLSPVELHEADWQQLKNVFTTVKCMRTGTSLVGNSKVMAHALPNLVPPVDREYTLKFLFGSKDIRNDIEREWFTLENILRGFFYPVLDSPLFSEAAQQWMRYPDQFPWDTSELKVIDNLVIGLVRMEKTTTSESVSAGARRR